MDEIKRKYDRITTIIAMVLVFLLFTGVFCFADVLVKIVYKDYHLTTILEIFYASVVLVVFSYFIIPTSETREEVDNAKKDKNDIV